MMCDIIDVSIIVVIIVDIVMMIIIIIFLYRYIATCMNMDKTNDHTVILVYLLMFVVDSIS